MTNTIIICFLNMFSLLVGVKIGQSSIKGKEIQLNPVKAVKNEINNTKEEKKQSLQKRKIETMLHNIDSYDGTGIGQKEIPKD